MFPFSKLPYDLRKEQLLEEAAERSCQSVVLGFDKALDCQNSDGQILRTDMQHLRVWRF